MHAGDGDMEVGSDFGPLPFRALPPLFGKVSEQLCFKLFKQLPPTGGVATKRGVRIDRVNSFEYATVELIKADALMIVKSMDDLLGNERVSESLCVRLSSRRSFTDNDYGVTEEQP
ncbi:hypothetical protein [Corynebacterium gottingense]|uniref:hypothetical protein n=1 Tax=Corynebacterium gottingense TaxID=2041036 RepID=UPI0025B444A3|nr:hypothetical protein [Corynebacterium gottingense]WJZ12481.1 hypothetical protein CGOTT_02615 [Corynebacterium gottingense]WJZ14800.1 hypothetical protein CGOTTB_02605 [Corynebacterium gottingense]